jgi:predicted pyridoxine 5'-phosphate oxidase superfamily flavin-nucleotide-binding protein
MNQAQSKFGEPLEIVRKKISSSLTPMVQDFVRQAPFAVLATASETGDCDASPKGGRPGFVRVVDEKHLVLPDIAGKARVNGRVSLLDAEKGKLKGVAPEVFDPDDNTRLIQGILLEVEEAYLHCPRAFTFSKLWDVERIGEKRAEDPNRYWLGRWKEEMKKAGAPPLEPDQE